MQRIAEGHRLRLGRSSEFGRIYHITITCEHRLPRFHDWSTGRCAVRGMQAISAAADTLCYVVMPDHVHWLFQLLPKGDLSSTVQQMKSVTTRAWRRLTNETGPLWQKGFYDHALRREEDVVATARYMVANPLRAGLTTSVGHYPLWDAVWL